jgi:hypothetical protein
MSGRMRMVRGSLASAQPAAAVTERAVALTERG